MKKFLSLGSKREGEEEPCRLTGLGWFLMWIWGRRGRCCGGVRRRGPPLRGPLSHRDMCLHTNQQHGNQETSGGGKWSWSSVL